MANFVAWPNDLGPSSLTLARIWSNDLYIRILLLRNIYAIELLAKETLALAKLACYIYFAYAYCLKVLFSKGLYIKFSQEMVLLNHYEVYPALR